MSLRFLVTLATIVNLASGQANPDPPAAGDGPPLTVNTPTSVQACLPVALSWSGGTPPVYVSLITGGQVSSPILKDFGAQTDTSLTWKVDQPAGSSLSVQIRDSKGKLNYSDKFTVQPSTQTCKTEAPGSTAPSGGSTPTTPGSNTTKPGSSPTPSSSSPPSTSSATAGSSNTAATTPGGAAGQAGKSDASRAIPGLFVLAMAGALALFA